MYSYDQQMSEIHTLLAWCAVALVILRGLGLQFGASWSTDSRLRVLVFCVFLLLSVTGLSLWVLRHYNLLRDSWLPAKLLAMVAYMVCAHLAIGLGRFRPGIYLGALLLLAYMIGVSMARSPWLGLI